VVGTFPNNAVAIGPVGAVRLDMHEESIAGDRRYLCKGSMAKLYEVSDKGANVAIDGGE